MRNFVLSRWCRSFCAAMCFSLPMAMLQNGCVSPRQADPVVNEGFAALESRQFDAALAKADAYLREYPHGEDSAEALYLRGRAYEGRTATSSNDARANLQAARAAYTQALAKKPPQPLKGYLHSSLANVAYFQDDYATAVEEWSQASQQLKEPDLQAWALYRKGVSQQRLGRFVEADTTFTAVQARFAGSIPAQRSRDHLGARSFSVQLATLTSASNADNLAASVRRQGVNPIHTIDAQGRHVIRVGPVNTFAEAQTLRARFASQHPDALIVP